MEEVLVRAEGVGKKFCRSLKRSLWYGVQDIARELNPLARAGHGTRNQDLSDDIALRPGEFWAARDVSFELRRGECLGLVGRNGAGKTTLLKMLNGLIKPDTGRIEMRGKVGALIALGTGFNPILTGRENVYINGSVLGLKTREIDAKIDEIIDFSELREFIDTPVQNYSSGMQVRLGFAVATAVDPDVLILDEVLAVGDASFRHKCYHRINKLIKNSAVILVSHAMDYIGSVSTSVGMMHHGVFQSFPNVLDGIAAYEAANESEPGQGHDGGSVFAFYPPVIRASVEMVKPQIAYGESLEVRVELELSEPIPRVELSFAVLNQSEQYVVVASSSRLESSIGLPAGSSVVSFQIENLLLHDGRYRWSFAVLRHGSIEHTVWAMKAGEFVVRSPHKSLGNVAYVPRMSFVSVASG